MGYDICYHDFTWQRFCFYGSKDMYPEGQAGYRASLMGYSFAHTGVPFTNAGCLKAYAKAGEHIYCGHSGMLTSNGNAKIVWYAPDGTSGTFLPNSSKDGLIEDRTQELAGPNFNGKTGGYRPVSFTVTAEQEGVWEIYFVGAKDNDRNVSDGNATMYGIETWTQPKGESNNMAFDITVTNTADTKAIPGRVYATSLNISTFANGVTSSCYSTLYVLTNVGYLYRWNLNGANGHHMTLFVNNKGRQVAGSGTLGEVYVDPVVNVPAQTFRSYEGGTPSYRTQSLMNKPQDEGYIHDPRIQDNSEKVIDANGNEVWRYEDVTHKIFFCKPAEDLPASAKAVIGGVVTDTWLVTHENSAGMPIMSNLTLVGKESGVPDVVGPEGVNISFESSVAGEYTINMEFNGYVSNTITGECVEGKNTVEWDGKDGAGTTVVFTDAAEITLSGDMKVAEVHFPIGDFDANPNGFILELLDADGDVVSDVVYWDDQEITSATVIDGKTHVTEGVHSASGAHKWNEGTGDPWNRVLVDTWSYAKGHTAAVTVQPKFEYIDLAIKSIEVDKEVAKIGELVTYTLEVENVYHADVEFNGSHVETKCDADSASVGVWFPNGGFITTEVSKIWSDDPSCTVVKQPSGEEYGLGYISLKNGKSAKLLVKGYAISKLAHTEVIA